jgi:hypothetical protein
LFLKVSNLLFIFIFELFFVYLKLLLNIQRRSLLCDFSAHLFKFSLILSLFIGLCLLNILLKLLLKSLSILFKLLIHLPLELVNLSVVLLLYLPLLVFELFNVVFVDVEGPSLLLFEFLKFEFKTLLLRLLHRLSYVRILVYKSLLFTFKFLLEVPLSLAQLVLCVFLQLKLFSLFLLLKLLSVYRNLAIDFLFNLSADLFFFFALVQLPPLLLLFDFRLIGLEDLLLLQFKILVYLFDRSGEVLLKKLSLLFDVFVDLSLYQRVIMLA